MLTPLVEAWEKRGFYHDWGQWRIFVVDTGDQGPSDGEPLLVIHGFPTCSFDFAAVVDRWAGDRRVVLFDMVGFGLSDKPDVPYSMAMQADLVESVCAEMGMDRFSLLTHDMGDTVGGELLARQSEGRWPVEITHRVLTNGSIYIEMAHLTAGQTLLLELPDERLETSIDPTGVTLTGSLRATLCPGSPVDDALLGAAAGLVMHKGGDLLLPRTIRYIEERRRNQERFTGAIESHPSPLTIVWGVEDPIAVSAMAARLHDARPDSDLVLMEGVGHYPMIEAPYAFAETVSTALRGE